MYSFLYQGVFSLAFLNFLVFWTDLFFSSPSRKQTIQKQNTLSPNRKWELFGKILSVRYLNNNQKPKIENKTDKKQNPYPEEFSSRGLFFNRSEFRENFGKAYR